MTIWRRVQAMHRFFSQHMFYPLALSSAMACAIVIARLARTHEWSFVFLIWNLFLAWIPYTLSLWADAIGRRRPRAWWLLLLPSALWLLFFPNALYILTDFVHLRARPPVPLWYDLGLLASFAWSGCFLAVASLHTMQALVRQFVGAALSWLFVLGAVGLCGLGVYLGRFERWNSWDVLTSPHAVLADAIRPLLFPLAYKHSLGVSAMFAAILFVCYVMFIAARHGAGYSAAERE